MTSPQVSDESFGHILDRVRTLRVEADEPDRQARGLGTDPRPPWDRDTPSRSVVSAAHLTERLASRVLHQQEAIETAAKVLAARLGVARLHPEHPHAFLLATGPTGTGKTTLAHAIAESVYDDPKRVVRVDCSELPSSASVSALIGPPPGYVGFDQPDGWLTTRVAELGQGVVLFDEVEKAHPDVWRLLLQIGEGRLRDNTGRTASFSSTTVLLTANVGAAEAAKRTIGFGNLHRDASQIMSDAVLDTFPPEVLSRIDATLVFRRLPPDANVDIAWRTWSEYEQRMRRLGWTLELERPVLHQLINNIPLDAKGVRELERAIEFDLLAELNGLEPGRYRATLANDKITWA